jgi:2-polyprenyl-6-hydroxyphenyl methylase/3-demethylubiquinone-9 3-methyltransferase
MPANFKPVADREAACKCCGTAAALYGVVDFHRNCLNVRHPALAVCGIPIYYYQCPACGFLFATAFDQFTTEDFLREIYNQDYILVDPDYREARPRANADVLLNVFRDVRPERILDYGGGEGLLAETLQAAGLENVDTYDPFVERHAARPSRRYDCIVSFEVLEHATDPARTLADMNDLLTPGGLILFSTLLQPRDIDQQGLNWWYAGPRNGHVSLHTQASLDRLARPHDLGLASFNECFHAWFREVPAFARHFLRVPAPGG